MQEIKKPEGAGRGLGLLLLLVVVAGAIGFGVFRGIGSRVASASAVREETLKVSVPAVSVTIPKQGALQNEIVLPGNVQAFTEAPIYARANGYLKSWTQDIGARVKAGQLLAEIEAPELDQQVRQARAQLQQAQAGLEQATANYEQGKSNADLAKLTAERWNGLVAKGAVSRQENDQYQAQAQALAASLRALERAVAAARSNIASLEADLARLGELQSFKQVRAPFDGIITARNTDVGALINAGNGGPAQELFHLAATTPLRVFVSVPQIWSQAGAFDEKVELTLAEFPGKRFAGKVVRRAGAIDAATRTLLTEVNVDNQAGILLPGAYAQVHLKLATGALSVIVPVSAVLFRSEGLRVGVVRDGNKAELLPVTMGKDFGTEVEITTGLAPGESVIETPPDSLVSGMEVRIIKTRKAN